MNAAGIVAIGDQGPGTSTITVTGPGSALTATGGLVIGQTGTTIGTLTVADGGVVSAPGSTIIGTGSTLNLGTGGLSGAIVTPTIDNDGAIVANFTDTLTVAADISGTGTLSKAGTGTLILAGTNSYSGGTTVTGGLINFLAGGLGTGTITVNGAGLQWATGNTSDISAQLAAIGSGGATFDTNGNNVSFATALTGSGGLTKAGGGTLTLAGASYTGATNVNGGTLQAGAANVFASSSAVTVASGATLAFNGFNQTLASLAGAGSVTMGAGSHDGGRQQRQHDLLRHDQRLGRPDQERHRRADAQRRQHLHRAHHRQRRHACPERQPRRRVTVNSGGVLSGTGRLGTLVNNGGIIAPGNSIGTLTVNGNFTQNGGIYQVEVNAAGQNDRINVAGSATLNGGTVQVLAKPAATRATPPTRSSMRPAGSAAPTRA